MGHPLSDCNHSQILSTPPTPRLQFSFTSLLVSLFNLMKKIGLAWERRDCFGDRFSCFRVVHIFSSSSSFFSVQEEEKVPACAKPSRSTDKKELSEREAATPRQRYGLSKQRALQMTISRGKQSGWGGDNIREKRRRRGETNVDELVGGEGRWVWLVGVGGGATQCSVEGWGGGVEGGR